MKKSNCLAMILAGGKGSRLGVLTKDQAKPGLLFGGKYRIIDFPLSNCRNSGIDTVGILTQYQPLELNWYIGNGSSWNLDSTKGVCPAAISERRRFQLVSRHGRCHLSELELCRNGRRRLRPHPVRRPHLFHGLRQDAQFPQETSRQGHYRHNPRPLG